MRTIVIGLSTSRGDQIARFAGYNQRRSAVNISQGRTAHSNGCRLLLAITFLFWRLSFLLVVVQPQFYLRETIVFSWLHAFVFCHRSIGRSAGWQYITDCWKLRMVDSGISGVFRISEGGNPLPFLSSRPFSFPFYLEVAPWIQRVWGASRCKLPKRGVNESPAKINFDVFLPCTTGWAEMTFFCILFTVRYLVVPYLIYLEWVFTNMVVFIGKCNRGNHMVLLRSWSDDFLSAVMKFPAIKCECVGRGGGEKFFSFSP